MTIAAGRLLPMHAVGPLAHDAGTSLGSLTLPDDAEVVGRAGGLEFDVLLHFGVVHPVEDLFVLFRRDLLVVGNLNAAADRHEKEQVQGLCPGALGQFERSVHLVRVVVGHGCVDLEWDPGFGQVLRAERGRGQMRLRRGRCRASARLLRRS